MFPDYFRRRRKGLLSSSFFKGLNVFLNDFFGNLRGPALFRRNPP